MSIALCPLAVKYQSASSLFHPSLPKLQQFFMSQALRLTLSSYKELVAGMMQVEKMFGDIQGITAPCI
ncbi:hypothetical protein SAMN05216308_104214 [Nitrosospira sp. Nsp13]|nr:hypothetical protein SAMN05216308_104214 [Nitrosospira sp. Nsp13]